MRDLGLVTTRPSDGWFVAFWSPLSRFVGTRLVGCSALVALKYLSTYVPTYPERPTGGPAGSSPGFLSVSPGDGRCLIALVHVHIRGVHGWFAGESNA